MITECEWRRQVQRRRRRRTTLWGAQYIVGIKPRCALVQDRSFRLFLLLLSFALAMLMPQLFPAQPEEVFAELSPDSSQSITPPRQVRDISYVLPSEVELTQQIYTAEELLRGRMLLLDEEHPLPAGVPAPNTASIAAYGKGRVPVENLQIKSGKQTIDALAALFLELNSQGMNGLIVSGGTVSQAEQRQKQESSVRDLSKTHSISEAVKQTLSQLDAPGFGEMLQEYTVAITPQSQQKHLQWQQLLHTAWKHGFIRSDPDGAERKANRFRWVGKAHATAMTYLDLSMEEYLRWMHEKGVLVIREKEKIKYVILCQPMNGTHILFDLPVQAQCDASLDNLGYAIVACTFP